MIPDHLVVGIELNYLQTKSDFTVNKVKKLIRQKEAVQQQEGILKSSNETLEVRNQYQKYGHKAKGKRVRSRSLSQPMTRRSLPSQPTQNTKVCINCGKIHISISHVLLKTQHAFAVTEGVITVHNVCQINCRNC